MEIQVIRKLPDELLHGGARIFVVAQSPRDIPPFLKECERFKFLYLDFTEDLKRVKISERMKFVAVMPGVPTTSAYKIQQNITTDIGIARLGGAADEAISALSAVVPKEQIPVEYLALKEVKPSTKKYETTPLAVGAEVTGTRRIVRKGELSEFVLQNADYSFQNVGEEIERLFQLAHDKGIPTTKSSVYQVFNRLRKLKTQEAPRAVVTSAVNDAPIPTPSPISIPSVTEAGEVRKEEAPKPSVEATQPAGWQEPWFIRRLPSEAKVAQGEEWYKPHESVWISFLPNRELEDNSQKSLDSNGKQKLQKGSLSQYVGFITARAGQKVVFPDDVILPVIVVEYARTNEWPVHIPCFLEIRSQAYYAHYIDIDRYLGERSGVHPDLQKQQENRLQHLESCIIQQQAEIERLKAEVLPQDAIVVVDFQNFERARRDYNLNVSLQTVVEAISEYKRLVPRQVRGVYVVDFDTPANRRDWRLRVGFEFYPVPQRKDPQEQNPTDQYIYQAAISAIEKFRLKRGSLVAVISGDADFVPLYKDLESEGYNVMVVSHPENTPAQVRRQFSFLDLSEFKSPKER